ncbi:flagellar hook-associated protein 2 [Peribacillus cavernae]|uniref:Flagellar hook-associated protein 2 n=1 Tax=Peribacillus cavernae TaxID=1674310 RepID=A0A433HT57_9BACI|nr:flagellar hook-associated protein 2 [Peribacillus cavernae]MDQ0218400.1 flagellar hook-associated protein 2 [Peribacillus cavernae]RUQ31405.1 flagellar hook-associated protein 2 [Peribacillus cavernae]
MVRIGGLASGMDIDQLVSDMMKAERIPLDKVSQKKQYTEWQRDDFREMNKLLFDLDKSIFDGVSKQGSFIKKTVTVSDPDAVSVKNINSTIDFSGTVKVGKLATAASIYSYTPASISDSSQVLSDFTGSKDITIQTITKDGSLEATDKVFKLTIVPGTDTLDSILSKINANSGVTAFYDNTTKQISLTAKNTGDVSGGPEIKLTGDFFTNVLNVDLDNVAADARIPKTGSLGANAEFTYNGLNLTRPSNTFQINGVELTLKQQTSNNVTFSSAPDVDAIMDTVVKFVAKYNETIEKIRGELDEKKYRDFQPLTSEQKKDMDEKDIELWEEKAKSGTLRNNSILSGSLNKMRMNLYNPVTSSQGLKQLGDIGITTSSNYLEGGKLVINEEDLRKAISENPNAVYELFQKDGATTEEKGLARRLRDTIKTTMTDIESKAGKASSVNNTFTIGRLLDGFDKQITNFEDRLVSTEDRYWRQFTAMEKAIQRSNEQMNYLMQQFGGA